MGFFTFIPLLEWRYLVFYMVISSIMCDESSLLWLPNANNLIQTYFLLNGGGSQTPLAIIMGVWNSEHFKSEKIRKMNLCPPDEKKYPKFNFFIFYLLAFACVVSGSDARGCGATKVFSSLIGIRVRLGGAAGRVVGNKKFEGRTWEACDPRKAKTNEKKRGDGGLAFFIPKKGRRREVCLCLCLCVCIWSMLLACLCVGGCVGVCVCVSSCVFAHQLVWSIENVKNNDYRKASTNNLRWAQ